MPARLIYIRHTLPKRADRRTDSRRTPLRGLIGGGVVVENVFARPGLGTALVSAVLARDYPVVQGIILVLGVTVVLVNTIVDLVLGVVAPRSLSRQAGTHMLRAFRNAPSGMAGAAAILLILAISVLAPIWLGAAAATDNVLDANRNPSLAHLLGIDQLGRDILARLLVATRLSIGLALSAVGVASVIGIPFGAVAAVLTGRPRSVVLRAIDTLLAFPPIIVAIFLGAIVGPSAAGATLGVAVAISFAFARVASTLALSIGGRDSVAAARVIGKSRWRRLLRYISRRAAKR